MGRMSDNNAPKSSYELAMERLAKKDADAGIEHKSVSGEQKAAIAEIRNFYQAKIAEVELLHQSKMASTFDPTARATLEQEYRQDRERLANERDRKIDRARQ